MKTRTGMAVDFRFPLFLPDGILVGIFAFAMANPRFSLHSSQRALRVDRKAFLDLARRLALRAFGSDAPFESVSVLLVDDRAMPDYKFRTFGLRLQTDVISL